MPPTVIPTAPKNLRYHRAPTASKPVTSFSLTAGAGLMATNVPEEKIVGTYLQVRPPRGIAARKGRGWGGTLSDFHQLAPSARPVIQSAAKNLPHHRTPTTPRPVTPLKANASDDKIVGTYLQVRPPRGIAARTGRGWGGTLSDFHQLAPRARPLIQSAAKNLPYHRTPTAPETYPRTTQHQPESAQ
jgi:hypothetical protein